MTTPAFLDTINSIARSAALRGEIRTAPHVTDRERIALNGLAEPVTPHRASATPKPDLIVTLPDVGSGPVNNSLATGSAATPPTGQRSGSKRSPRQIEAEQQAAEIIAAWRQEQALESQRAQIRASWKVAHRNVGRRFLGNKTPPPAAMALSTSNHGWARAHAKARGDFRAVPSA